jgi:heme/copper-type cytochrome/quinol oxidase subunit 3
MATTTYSPTDSQPRLMGRDRGSRSGIWVGIFAITMSFAAFTSALYVRQGSGDWAHIVLPGIMYANTVILLISSLTMEMSRRTIASSWRSGVRERGGAWPWLAATRPRVCQRTILGLAPSCRTGTLPGDEFQ